ncbi:hypothetical protein DQ04_03411010 [Trypanosoma grayi]|uniref:hypothetical protein n=1 Tax=Trypanosoma grayi TaxID=71804 RepID=UPI0004F4946A|nr:hypothetical protein DQ04_03411010 [Trypanosoma grayi]KEG10687.1 hypothetical protein DQ04_03411010 [Trypanosoma grayi]
MDVWRCATCSKLKPLSGDHLNGKKTVRSDCWPCGKKCTFMRESAAATRSAAPVVTAPFLFNPAMKVSSGKPAAGTAQAVAISNPFLTGAAALGTSAVGSQQACNKPPSGPFASAQLQFGAAMRATPSDKTAAEAPLLNPFAEMSVSPGKGPFASTTHTQTNITASSSNPFAAVALPVPRVNETLSCGSAPSSSDGTSPIIMQSASDRSRQSPPFTFTVSPSAVVPSNISYNAPTVRGDSGAEPEWICSVCYKRKDLHGDHLRGKTTVRSDCWPCAKKRTFILSTSELRATSKDAPQKHQQLLPPRSTTTTTTTTQTPVRELVSADLVVSPGVSLVSSASVMWRDPVIPSSDTVMNMFVAHAASQQQQQQREKSSPMAVAPDSSEHNSADTAAAPLLTFTFEGEVLRGYRQQLVDGIRTRTVWYNRTLYVLAPENSHGESGSVAAAPQLGAAAVVFLAVEHKLALSPFRRMRRLFCPDEFSFAAACAYANTFLAGHHTSPHQSSFVVYGPRVDHTAPTTQWGSIIENCAHARQLVVSGEQRVEGAQSIFRSTGWLTLPLYATAEAIRLMEAQQQQQGADAEFWGADVVLVTATMKLEELPQAAALALPVKPFL